MTGASYELKDHRIPIERSRERGWGKVSIPADVNPADNEFYFVFDRPQPRKTLIVTGDQPVMTPVRWYEARARWSVSRSIRPSVMTMRAK